MNNLSQAEVWRRQLGYLPVPLFGEANEKSFVMLNGGKGNFCLDVEDGDPDPAQAAQRAWSADVDHYMAVRGGDLSLLRWDQPAGWKEKYKVSEVATNLQLFQRYIESRHAPRERSIVARAVSSYRSVRARGKKGEDRQVLLAFMGLLRSAWGGQEGAAEMGSPLARRAGHGAR